MNPVLGTSFLQGHELSKCGKVGIKMPETHRQESLQILFRFSSVTSAQLVSV